MSRNKNLEDCCMLAIKKTLAYRSIFKYPLSLYQLKTQLISDREFKSKFFEEQLQKAIKRGFVKEKDNKYYLPGIIPINWEERCRNTQKLISKNNKTFKILESIPWIKCIAVTGSVSAYNTDKNSDVDVLIITNKNRVWITRGFVTALLKLMKKFPNVDGEKGKICTNLYIDEKNLRWPKNKRNMHIAHDIMLMQPVYDTDNTYLRFLKANKWVERYFSHFKIYAPEGIETKKIYKSFIVNFLENIARNLQLLYMKRKKTSEVTLKHLIHFNKNDKSQGILDQYKKILENRKI